MLVLEEGVEVEGPVVEVLEDGVDVEDQVDEAGGREELEDVGVEEACRLL